MSSTRQSASDAADQPGEAVSAQPLEPLARLQGRLLEGMAPLADEVREALDSELRAGLEAAANAEAELLTVMNPVTRPVSVRLAPLATDDRLDTMYAQEWGEYSVSSEGVLYLVYRRRDGNDYGIEWTPATTLPPSLLPRLSPALLAAILAPRDDAAAG